MQRFRPQVFLDFQSLRPHALILVASRHPAAKAGIEPGDILEAINDKTTAGMSLAEIRSVLTGDAGSQLNFTVIRPRKAEQNSTTNG